MQAGSCRRGKLLSSSFYYIPLDVLVREYFFASKVFCDNYAADAYMEHGYYARGL